MRRLWAIGGLIVFLLGFNTAPAMAGILPAHGKPTFHVLLVTDAAGLGDHAFNDLAWTGIKRAVNWYHIGADVLQTHSSKEYVSRLTQAVGRRPNLIVAVGSSMSSAVYRVGIQHPQQKFILIDATPTQAKGRSVTMANVANLWFREQEAGYLAGVVAGWMEKARVSKARHNTIGFLGSFPTVDVNHYLAGYVAGARAVEPGITILGGYSHSASDGAKARTIGLAQLAQGADILFGVAGVSSRGYLQAAGDKRAYAIGADNDLTQLGSFMLTSAVKRVDVAVEITIQRSLAHPFVGGDHVFGAKEGAVGITPLARSVPTWLRSRLVRDTKLIAEGKIVPPTVITK